MPTSQISEGTINGASQRTIIPWPYGVQGMSFTFNSVSGGGNPAKHAIVFSTFTGASASAYWDWGAGGAFEQVAVPNHAYAATTASYNVVRYGDVAGPTAWTYSNTATGITNLRVSLTGLVTISISQMHSLGSVDLTGCSALTSFACSNDTRASSLIIAGCQALTTVSVPHSAIAALDISACPLLATLDLSSNSLITAVVDGILNALAAGSVSAGTVNLANNAIPSSASVTARAILLSRGWTVVVNY